MKKILILSLIVSMPVSQLLNQSVNSPDEFLGYKLGTRYTFHYKAVEYFKYVAEKSSLAEYRDYGTSWEGRPLGICIISAAKNLEELEEYRKNNLIKTGLLKGTFTGMQKPFIWLAYNIHGNEAAGMEAAMKTLHTLVSGQYSDWLDSCIIIIDPCQNPDGRDLYATRFLNSGNLIPNPDGNSREHRQEWPGSRANHYMFDLNRDWAWQTQTETAQRIALYNQFMPHVFADFHEMGAESSYFFAPGAEPWHEVITPWQREFHKLTGATASSMFDAASRLYFSKENYDLFCPSFGDTWPLFNGAMGFTFEQGGGEFSGIFYKKESGDTLTLEKRIEGHLLSSLAVIKTAFENREKLLKEFNGFFTERTENQRFGYKSIIIKGSGEPSNLKAMLQLLKKSQISYTFAGNPGKKYKGFDFLSDGEGEVTIEKGDILINTVQPQSRLIQVLFEPDSKPSDSLTYDLTAWALPYIYNLKSFALKDPVRVADEQEINQTKPDVTGPDKPYAYVINFTGFDELKLVSTLTAKDIKVRYSLKAFSSDQKNFNTGSFIITRSDNGSHGEKIDRVVPEEARKLGIRLFPVASGLADQGKDFGSEYFPLVKKRAVAILTGEGTSSSQAGSLWYFFEQELEHTVSLIDVNEAGRMDLSDYGILIMTSGDYSRLKDTIVDFARRGGRVIAIENAITAFAGEKSTALFKAVEMRNAELKAAEKKGTSTDTSFLKKFENIRRASLTERSAGSIYRVTLDDTHPYAFGLGKQWFLMKRSTIFPFLQSGNNIGYILNNEPVSGFAGYRFRQKAGKSLVLGSENIGKGEVVYITDDPYFRAYWKSGRVLLGNLILR